MLNSELPYWLASNPLNKSPFAQYWALNPKIVFLNHGAFGACPKKVLNAQQHIRARIEDNPVYFFVHEFEGLLDSARKELAAFVNVNPTNLVFVSNATSAVNTVLRSLNFSPDDQILTTNHEYNACKNAIDFVTKNSGAQTIVAEIPFPIESPKQVIESILAKVTTHTRLALIDHVTSPTALVFPIEKIVSELKKQGVDTLVDGAHSPGMIPLDIQEIDPAYYAGNCHKWLCAPKGAAFLYVRHDKQNQIRPLSISHGANSLRKDKSRFQLEFDWTGTDDPSAWLCIPESIRFLNSLLPGGWNELISLNHNLALKARDLICNTLNISPPCPDEMIGSMASFPLADGQSDSLKPPLYLDPLKQNLYKNFGIEVPIIHWPAPPKRLLRISSQIYNTEEQYEYLAQVLKQALIK